MNGKASEVAVMLYVKDLEQLAHSSINSRANEVIEEYYFAMRKEGIGTFITEGNNHSDDGGIVSVPLREVIDAYGLRECSDLRDRVYALLGQRKFRYLQRLRGRPQLQAAYGKSTADVFFDIKMFRGLLDNSFAGQLRESLDLALHKLELVSLSRMGDALPSSMKLRRDICSNDGFRDLGGHSGIRVWSPKSSWK